MSERPDVLVIAADQWRGDCLGCEGRLPVMTPHLDQLANEGVRFTRAWADCPVCMPQRMTMLTGQVGARFGRIANFPGDRPAIEPAITLPTILREEAGYQTRGIGKMHFEPPRARYGFDHVDLHPDDYILWLEEGPWAGGFRGHGMGGNEVYPCPPAVPERYSHTHWVVDRAVQALAQRDPDSPAFTYLVFEAPHSPFDPPEEHLRLYDRVAIPEPAHGDWADDPPPALRDSQLTHNHLDLAPDWLREARRRYLAQCTHIDLQLGRLFGALNRSGRWRDTLVIFTADHGELLGDHGCFHKLNFLAGAGRVPLLVKPPAGTGLSAFTCDEPVLTADLFATVLEACGLEARAPHDGRSLLSALAGGPVGHDVVCGECATSAMATDGALRYCWYRRGGHEQLFDCAVDPDDLHDLAPERPADLARLRERLLAWGRELDRPWAGPDGLVAEAGTIDEARARRRNATACRGDMRYGDGY